jgi:hypothetical protein
MSFMIAIGAALGAAAFWYFRLGALSRLTHDLREAGQTGGGAVRRRRSRVGAERSAGSVVTDPAAAAAATLLALATLGADRRPDHEALVKDGLRTLLPAEMLEEAFAAGQRLAGQALDPNDLSLRSSKLWLTVLTPEERLAFYRLAVRIVEATAPAGGPTELQRQSLTRLKDRLGIFRV